MEARLTMNAQMKGLTDQEFRQELGVVQRNFQKELLKRTHLLKLRDTQIFNQIISESNDDTTQITEELTTELNDLRTERDRNQAIAFDNFSKIGKYTEMLYKRRYMSKYFQALKDNWMVKKEAKTYIKTGVQRFEYNHTTVEELTNRVDAQISTELGQKNHKVSYLETLIAEFEDQYKIELQKRALVKNVCDDGLKKGSMKMSNDAMRMSMSTLKDLESKFLKTYQSQLISQHQATTSKLEHKMVFQPVQQ
jgi:hypothetical protein